MDSERVVFLDSIEEVMHQGHLRHRLHRAGEVSNCR